MKVSHWQRKLSGVCQYLITQTGALYRSSMVEHVAVNHRVAGSSPADTALLDSLTHTNLFVFTGSSSISALSSNRLGHRPFTAAIGIRVPVGSY